MVVPSKVTLLVAPAAEAGPMWTCIPPGEMKEEEYKHTNNGRTPLDKLPISSEVEVPPEPALITTSPPLPTSAS